MQALCLLAVMAAPAQAQTYTTWILAEGAANTFFDEEILIANPSSLPANVEIRLLPQTGPAPAPQVIVVPATSRYTFRVNSVVSNGAVGAVVTSDRDIVVERSMYWAYGSRRGGHNAQGVLAPAADWYLAEGVIGFFETFILITNTSATPADVTVTLLRESGAPIATPHIVPGNGRVSIYVNPDFPQLQSPFSTVVHQSNGATIVVERAMYWNGFEGGHSSAAVTAPSQTWLFAEGTTGSNAVLDFQTYLLLANPGATAAAVTVDFFRDASGPVSYTTTIPANARKTLFLDDLVFANAVKELSNSSFSIRVTSDVPILAERSLYWSSSGITFIDGHNSPGVTAEASKWAFAEGREGRFQDSGPTTSYDTYFLFSNSGTQALRVKGTFVREDGRGLVHTFVVNPTSRYTLLTGQFPELSNQRFAAFFEAVDASGAPITSQTFVAERAMYWGDGYFGGHAATGTPWTAAVATPPIVDLTPTVVSVTPSSGPITGGTSVTITGTNFLETTTVEFGDRAALGVQRLTDTTIVATSPAGAAVGAVPVVVRNQGHPAGSLAGGFTYSAVAPFLLTDYTLAFGDSLTAGVTWNLCNMGGTMVPCSPPADPNFGYPGRLRTLLQQAYPSQAITVQPAGVPGECASTPGCVPSAPSSGRQRLPTTLSAPQDLVVILQGVNDLNAGLSNSTIIASLQNMILTAQNAGKRVIICNLLPVKPHEVTGLYKADPARIASLNAAIEQLKTSMDIPRVDMTAAFGANYGALLSVDGLHPSAAGYQRMANAIFQKIVEQFQITP